MRLLLQVLSPAQTLCQAGLVAGSKVMLMASASGPTQVMLSQHRCADSPRKYMLLGAMSCLPCTAMQMRSLASIVSMHCLRDRRRPPRYRGPSGRLQQSVLSKAARQLPCPLPPATWSRCLTASRAAVVR